MPRSVPFPIRQVIQRRLEQGDVPSAIADALQVPVRTVRHLAQRFRERAGDLAADYQHCGRAPCSDVSPLIAEAIELREQHAAWGAGLIRVILQESHPGQPVPSERTLRRWLSRLGSQAAPAGRRPTTNSDRACRPHEVWQLDAADQKRLQTGEPISWLRAVDECSGAVLKTVVFSRRKLQSSLCDPRPNSLARAVQPVGPSGTTARRQRVAVGVVG